MNALQISRFPAKSFLPSSRYFSTRARRGGGGGRFVKTGEELKQPDFNQLLRNLYKRGHPDILRAYYPTYSNVNNESIQVLNGILDTIRASGEYPPAMKKEIPFFLIEPKNINHVKEYKLKVHTTGGDCKKQITTCFESFFKDTRILLDEDLKFTWNKEYFPLLTETEAERRNREIERERQRRDYHEYDMY
jgi:hypothetical protein